MKARIALFALLIAAASPFSLAKDPDACTLVQKSFAEPPRDGGERGRVELAVSGHCRS